MSTTTDSPTLTEKAYALAFGETATGSDDALDVLKRALPEGYDDPAQFALGLGIAIAIARSEDAFEPLERVFERALPAAAEAFKRFAGVDVLAPRVAA